MNATPKPKLKEGEIYSADNGELICLQCAGASAKYTGRDRSGQKVTRMNDSDAASWTEIFKKPMTCECGKTTHKSQIK